MKTSTNWVHDKKPEPSINDKIIELLSIPAKLVLVQLHELERLKKERHKDRHANYVNSLYQHYIVSKLPKTYLT